MIEQWLLRTWRSPMKVRSDKESGFFSFQINRKRGGLKRLEETGSEDSRLKRP